MDQDEGVVPDLVTRKNRQRPFAPMTNFPTPFIFRTTIALVWNIRRWRLVDRIELKILFDRKIGSDLFKFRLNPRIIHLKPIRRITSKHQCDDGFGGRIGRDGREKCSPLMRPFLTVLKRHLFDRGVAGGSSDQLKATQQIAAVVNQDVTGAGEVVDKLQATNYSLFALFASK